MVKKMLATLEILKKNRGTEKKFEKDRPLAY
jgi:hypothetical protein